MTLYSTDLYWRTKRLDCKIELVSTPCYYGGHRWWFICPLVVNGNVCGRRVGVLYLGDGEYFGCMHCYDLAYLCQKESGKYDSLHEGMGFDPKEVRKALKYGGDWRNLCKSIFSKPPTIIDKSLVCCHSS